MEGKPIISDPAVLSGRPVIAGTRIAVDALLEWMADGATIDRIREIHPGLTTAAIREALRFAAETVRAGSPIENLPALDLHGPHAVSLADSVDGKAAPGIAIRAYFPEADAVSVRRLPAMPLLGWAALSAETPALEDDPAPILAFEEPPPRPMERIHPDGVFEAVFPGETVPFPYQLTVTSGGGETRVAEDPYRFSSTFSDQDLRELAELVQVRGPAEEGPPHTWRLYDKLGAHPAEHEGIRGVAFAVWAPNAAGVSLVGDFNRWDELCHPMRPLRESGLWELFVPGLPPGALYKYRITSRGRGEKFDKADPYAFAAELRPGTGSIVCDPSRYAWHDDAWLAERPRRQALSAPLAIYEVHFGSWRRAPAPGDVGQPRWLTYRELADQLVPYVKSMGYTHLEPMPLCEHPFDGSWGYQVTGFFAPTSRHGTPDDFRYFVDTAHQAGLGVILDWVPGHFPKDAHGLARFDGTCLYEHPDSRRSENLEWGTSSFNLERGEVTAFLLANALFWLDQFHVDGLRVDAVSSMIYLDYSRQHWLPNRFGGRENLEAATFLRRLNSLVHREHPGVLMVAEESTAWPRVTGPEIAESLGFDLKWNLGWMHDTIGYLQKDPLFRSHHHNDLTFSLVYAFNENFLLPFSHDEVVHGKRSMLSKMPGDSGQQFANLRTLYGYLYAHPGKKLLFMGGEFGQEKEWDHDGELEWTLLDREPHRRLQAYVRDLNRLYTAEPALHEADFGWEGFQWIDCRDAERSIVSFLRRGQAPDCFVVIAVNFTPVARAGYRLGVPEAGAYEELLNSDAAEYGGADGRNPGELAAEAVPADGQPHSVVVTLPPLAIVILARGNGARRALGKPPSFPA